MEPLIPCPAYELSEASVLGTKCLEGTLVWFSQLIPDMQYTVLTQLEWWFVGPSTMMYVLWTYNEMPFSYCPRGSPIFNCCKVFPADPHSFWRLFLCVTGVSGALSGKMAQHPAKGLEDCQEKTIAGWNFSIHLWSWWMWRLWCISAMTLMDSCAFVCSCGWSCSALNTLEQIPHF